SGDPAMALMSSSVLHGRIARVSRGTALLPPDTLTGKCARTQNARTFRAELGSAANTELIDDRLVAPFVGAPQVIEQLPARGNELQQPAPRMVVLHMSFEVLGEVVDPFGKD